MVLARSSAAGIVSSTAPRGTVALEPTPTDPANSAQAQRPPATPSGRPASSATAVSAVASQATAADTCHRRNPSVLTIAKSRRRRRIVLSSAWAMRAAANSASSPASASGVARTRE